MRIVCPICSATYDVPDTLLAPGRAARCARCGEHWVPLPEAPPHSPDPVAEAADAPDADVAPPERGEFAAPPLTAMERLASRPARLPGAPRGLRAAWAASVVLLLLLGWGLVAWRGAVMRSWPPSIRLYSVLGLGQAPAPPSR